MNSYHIRTILQAPTEECPWINLHHSDRNIGSSPHVYLSVSQPTPSSRHRGVTILSVTERTRLLENLVASLGERQTHIQYIPAYP